jgi:hypothetical protein
MTLDAEQQAKLEAWIAEKVVRRHCPACETAIDWQAADVLDLVISPCEHPSGTEIPVVPLVCPNCGYVTLFSAKYMGLRK